MAETVQCVMHLQRSIQHTAKLPFITSYSRVMQERAALFFAKLHLTLKPRANCRSICFWKGPRPRISYHSTPTKIRPRSASPSTMRIGPFHMFGLQEQTNRTWWAILNAHFCIGHCQWKAQHSATEVLDAAFVNAPIPEENKCVNIDLNRSKSYLLIVSTNTV